MGIGLVIMLPSLSLPTCIQEVNNENDIGYMSIIPTYRYIIYTVQCLFILFFIVSLLRYFSI